MLLGQSTSEVGQNASDDGTLNRDDAPSHSQLVANKPLLYLACLFVYTYRLQPLQYWQESQESSLFNTQMFPLFYHDEIVDLYCFTGFILLKYQNFCSEA